MWLILAVANLNDLLSRRISDPKYNSLKQFIVASHLHDSCGRQVVFETADSFESSQLLQIMTSQ